MENASKALVMAGGVLLAIMIIAVLMYVVQNSGQYTDREDKLDKIEQIVKFNQEYESYDKTLMRGTDVISVVNKSASYNQRVMEDKGNGKLNEKDPAYVNAYVKLKNKIEIGSKIFMEANKNYWGNSSEYINVIKNEEALKEFKRKFFKCTDIKYTDASDNVYGGRVKAIYFQEVDVGDIPDY